MIPWCSAAKKRPGRRLAEYAAASGEALALAHARGDRRSTRFEAAMADVLAEVADTLLEAAAGYAAQVIADWRLMQDMLPSAEAPAMR